MGYGVIGNTEDSDSFVLGSSPGTPAIDYESERSDSLVRPSFSLYVNGMSKRETINGVPVSEEQIAAWSAEAEAGFDVAVLKKRGRGRPGRGAEPSQVIALRLTLDEIAVIDERAEREGKSRSDVIREALHFSAA